MSKARNVLSQFENEQPQEVYCAKISELIKALQDIQDKEGDLPLASEGRHGLDTETAAEVTQVVTNAYNQRYKCVVIKF